jgi:nitroreductase
MTTTSSSSEPKPKKAKRGFEDSILWRIKLRLQFSGWLQYLVNAVAVLFMLLVAGIGWLIGFWPVLLVWLPLGVAALLFTVLIVSILTVKYGLHPTEPLPGRKTDLDAFDLMRARRSCRSFQSRTLTPADHVELMEAVDIYSDAGRQLGQQPIRFEYIAAPLTVWPVVGAHEFLVAIAPREYNRLAVIDVGRSLQKVVLQATRMGVATCWIGPGADQQSIVEHMGDRFDPATEHVICVCALGYQSLFKPLVIRLIRKLQHQRLPLPELFFDSPGFTTPLDTEAEPYSTYGRCYEVCQWSPSSFNGQTTRCAAVTEPIDGDARLVRFDFCAATTSRYYAAVALGIWCANWETGCEALGLHGNFAVLSSDDRAIKDAPDLPRYDVSWVIG